MLDEPLLSHSGSSLGVHNMDMNVTFKFPLREMYHKRGTRLTYLGEKIAVVEVPSGLELVTPRGFSYRIGYGVEGEEKLFLVYRPTSDGRWTYDSWSSKTWIFERYSFEKEKEQKTFSVVVNVEADSYEEAQSKVKVIGAGGEGCPK